MADQNGDSRAGLGLSKEKLAMVGMHYREFLSFTRRLPTLLKGEEVLKVVSLWISLPLLERFHCPKTLGDEIRFADAETLLSLQLSMECEQRGLSSAPVKQAEDLMWKVTESLEDSQQIQPYPTHCRWPAGFSDYAFSEKEETIIEQCELVLHRLEALVRLEDAGQAEQAGLPSQEGDRRPTDLMRLSQVNEKYKVTASHLRRLIRENKLKGYRRKGAPKNSPYYVSSADIRGLGIQRREDPRPRE